DRLADRPDHPTGDHDHVQPGGLRSLQGRDRPLAEEALLPDQGAIEVRREYRDVARKACRELDQPFGLPPVALTTYAATSAICFVVSCPVKFGIAPAPCVSRS